jgi:predicted amidophosphoribosyltransferase
VPGSGDRRNLDAPNRYNDGVLLPVECPICHRSGCVPCARCAASMEPAPAGTSIPAVLSFSGGGRRLLLALKYRNARPVARSLGRAMARRVRHERVDVVTWPPTSATRRRRRGYDQAELLARAVAWRLGVPCRKLLKRVEDPRGPQTGRSRSERLEGPTFTARRRVRGTVLLVDDVVTTGATLRAASGALLTAGARSVRCIAAAATP